MISMTGKVYLVGAGPGNAKLITVKGWECIQKADVVVYDRLASPRLLRIMKPGAEKIYVGKKTNRHTMKQEDINQLLVDLALAGKKVVRLKGGDPTIFGRVGEEAELLKQNNVPFEIVPGVTSAISVPAYAGIPVTHRDYASSISIITGHESPEKMNRAIHWDKVTNATGTLVFMMGVANIGYISKQLMDHGRPKDTPVALIRWGTWAEQDTLIGTLEDIEAKVIENKFLPPGVIVVGDVVKQRERLKWVESMPLFGKRILVTRARTQAIDLVDRIEELGGEAYELPVIETVPPASAETRDQLKNTLASMPEYDWVFFTSVNGVEYFFKHLEELGLDIRALSKARIVAIGPTTREVLRSKGIVAEEVQGSYQQEGLMDTFGDELLPGQKVLLPCGNLARSWLPDRLREKGLEVTVSHIYETVIPDEWDDDVIQLLEKGKIYAVTFTSSSTVTHLLALLKKMGNDNPVELLNKVHIVCIGSVTAQEAEKAGLSVSIISDKATMDSLTDALCELK